MIRSRNEATKKKVSPERIRAETSGREDKHPRKKRSHSQYSDIKSTTIGNV